MDTMHWRRLELRAGGIHELSQTSTSETVLLPTVAAWTMPLTDDLESGANCVTCDVSGRFKRVKNRHERCFPRGPAGEINWTDFDTSHRVAVI